MKISNRKSKGSQFEMSVRDSLVQKYLDVILTKQEGYVKQYDIWIPSAKIAIECKRHKGFSWNELEKYFLKLEKRIQANKDENDTSVYTPYLIFQGNHQPCLVMCNFYIPNEHTLSKILFLLLNLALVFQIKIKFKFWLT